jgi:hypothetical protein
MDRRGARAAHTAPALEGSLADSVVGQLAARVALLSRVLDLYREALSEGGECGLDLIQSRAMIEVEKPVNDRFGYAETPSQIHLAQSGGEELPV